MVAVLQKNVLSETVYRQKKVSPIFNVLIFFFFLLLIFDPADSIFRLKIPAFFLLIGYAVYKNVRLENTPLKVVCLFLLLAFYAFFIGFFSQGDGYSFSFALSKLMSCLYVTILFVFIGIKTDYLKLFAYALFLLCITIIVLFLYAFVLNYTIDTLYLFGNTHSSFTINRRIYGFIVFPSIYFHASPFLILALCYFAYRFMAKKTFKNLSILVISFVAQFLTGSRNNIIFSVVGLITVLFIYSKFKKRNGVFLFVISAALFTMLSNTIFEMFNMSDESNSLKVSTVFEYFDFFIKYPATFFFGQGFGGLISSPARAEIVPITELSYLDIIRWFGIFGGIFMLYVMLYPFIFAYKKKIKSLNWLLISYGIFLIMITLNPFFFNSVGITFFALVFSALLKEERNKLNSGSMIILQKDD